MLNNSVIQNEGKLSVALHTQVLEAGQGNVKPLIIKGAVRRKWLSLYIWPVHVPIRRGGTLLILLICSETNL